MSRMAETSVQAKALDYLSDRYRGRAKGGKLFAQAEVRTKREHGSKRADGLLAFKHWLWGVYVVSLEAKSFKTLPAIKPRLDRRRYVMNTLRAALLISILSGAFFFLYKWDDGFWQFIVPGGTFLLAAVVYATLTRKHYGHYSLRVIDQIEQYPADERWLAFSEDAFEALPDLQQKQLTRICRHHGVGLLTVRADGRVKRLARARLHWDWWHDYLRFYSKEKEIRAGI